MEPTTAAFLASMAGQGLAGWLQSGSNEEAAQAQRDALIRAEQQRQATIARLMDLYGGEENLKAAYNKYLQDYEQFDPTVQMGTFDYSKDVQDFLDPSMEYQRQVAERALQSSLQGQGGLYSGKAMKALQEQGQKLAQTDYSNAFNRMTTDRQFAYTDYLNRFKNEGDNKTAQLQKLSNLLNNASTNRNTVAGLLGQSGETQASLTERLGAVDSFRAAQNPFADFLRSTMTPKNLGGVAEDYFGDEGYFAKRKQEQEKEKKNPMFKLASQPIDTSAMDASVSGDYMWDDYVNSTVRTGTMQPNVPFSTLGDLGR